MKNLCAIMLILAIAGCGEPYINPNLIDKDGYITKIPFRIYILKDGTRCAYAEYRASSGNALAIDCDWIQK